jgi:hypothetical protein
MKFELKTEKENYLNSFPHFLKTFFCLALIILIFNIALKLGTISKHYQIEYNCRLLSVDKTNPNFKILSKLSNLKSKQKIWDFCREVVK